MQELSERERARIVDSVENVVATKFFDPGLNGVDWKQAIADTREAATRAKEVEEFETTMNSLLARLKASHCGFFHEKRPRVGTKNALAATIRRVETADGEFWMFQDVHGGGPAAESGVTPGDILIAIGDRPFPANGSPSINLGEASTLTVRRPNGSEERLPIRVPKAARREQPVVRVNKVEFRKLENGVGYVKVSMFPGLIGIDIAREITNAVTSLDADRLVVDLRGNTGGGMGCIRLASLLTAGRAGIGYSLTRTGASRGWTKDELPRLDRIPERKIELLPLALKFAFRDKSVAIGTEGLGAQRFHGRIAMLVNEHTASAAEIVVAFARENELATVIGVKTAGRLIGAKSFKVGAGYRVALPVVAFRTWQDKMIEGCGVEPTVHIPMNPEDLVGGRDPQLQHAFNLLN